MKGFQKLTKEEMGEIKGGYYSCPRSKGEFTRTYNALNKTQKKEYIKYCYEHNCTKYFNKALTGNLIPAEIFLFRRNQ